MGCWIIWTTRYRVIFDNGQKKLINGKENSRLSLA
jgi:hypothetical protein